MDISEIRKKAKKLKKGDQPSGKKKPSSRKKKSPDVKEEELVEESMLPTVEETEEEAVVGGEVETHGLLSETEMAPENEGGEVDFLSLAMSALYDEGYSTAADKVEDENIIELLCFMLSDEEYAVDIKDLKEIIKVMDVTEVPKVPPYVLGVISLRGNIIPLFDLRLRLGLEAKEYDRKTRIIIITNQDKNMAMVVDSVTEVVRLKEEALEPPPTLLGHVDAELLKNVGRHEDRLLILPNLSKVFTLA